jgi:hypothetical protein
VPLPSVRGQGAPPPPGMSLTEPWNSRRSLADLDPLAPGTEGNLGSNEGKSRTSVFWFVLVLGAGLMAPWNSWVLAYRYFDMVFNCHEGMEKNAECEEDSYHLVQYHFTTAFYVPTGLAVLLMLTRRGERVSIRARVVFALVLNVAVLGVDTGAGRLRACAQRSRTLGRPRVRAGRHFFVHPSRRHSCRLVGVVRNAWHHYFVWHQHWGALRLTLQLYHCASGSIHAGMHGWGCHVWRSARPDVGRDQADLWVAKD